jgi:outer membrane protein assembly factor BamB
MIGTGLRSTKGSIAVAWTALGILLAVSACSHMTQLGNTWGERTSVMFHVPDALLGCCAIADLGASGQLVVGRTAYRDGRSRVWLARVSSAGNVEWQHELPLESPQSGLSAGVSADRNGEAYVVGDMAIGRRSNLLVAKIRANGTLDWMKTLSLGLDTKGDAVILSKEREIVVAGFVRDAGPDGSIFVASFSATGDLSWHRRVAQTADQPQVNLHESKRGGYLVSGSFGITYMDPGGRQQWEYSGINVVAALEDRSGVVVISAPLRSQARGFVVHRLADDGSILSKQPALRDVCTIAGAWISERDRIIVAGNPCARDGELRISEVFDGGERSMAQIELPAGATALSAAQTKDGELVVAGVFNIEGPNALQGWFLKVPSPR